MTTPRQLTPPSCYHAEGPVWWDQWGGLRWVDAHAGDIVRLGHGGAVERHHVGDWTAAVRPMTNGGAIVALDRWVGVLDGQSLERGAGLPTSTTGELWRDPDIRFNEGATDPHGRFYCGAKDGTGRSRASLFRVVADGQVTRIESGIATSNGLGWSPAGDRAYYIDSRTQRIDVFDDDPERGLHGRRPLVEIPRGDGVPDGLCVDAEGYLWVALWDGFAVRRYSPAGRADGEVRLPVPRVTACTFGGPDLNRLFVTTSRNGVDRSRYPESGALFRADVRVTGLAIVPFAAERSPA